MHFSFSFVSHSCHLDSFKVDHRRFRPSINVAVALGNDLITRLVVLALHCLLCLALLGCPSSQHFDCSDLSLTSLVFCLFAHLSDCICVGSDTLGSTFLARRPPDRPLLLGPPWLGYSPIVLSGSDPLGVGPLASVSPCSALHLTCPGLGRFGARDRSLEIGQSGNRSPCRSAKLVLPSLW